MSAVTHMRAGANVPAEPENDVVALLRSPRAMAGLKDICGKVLDADRLVKLAVFSVNKTPLLARCTPGSVLGALMLSGQFGLEPNTPSQQAFLIPYKKRKQINGKWTDIYECQFQFGYRGMITLAYNSGIVTRLKAEAIRENDMFDYLEGSEHFLKYRKSLTARGDLIGAFCFTALSTGEDAATVLPAEFIEKIKTKSETLRSLTYAVDNADGEKNRKYAEAKLAETPWVQWEDAMWAKTAVKQHLAQLPIFDMNKQSRLANAVELDNAADAGIVDMESFQDPEAVRAAVERGQLSTHDPETGEVFEDAAPQLTHESTKGPTIAELQTRGKQQERVEVRETAQETKRETAPQAQTESKPATRRAAPPKEAPAAQAPAARQQEEDSGPASAPYDNADDDGAEEAGLFGNAE